MIEKTPAEASLLAINGGSSSIKFALYSASNRFQNQLHGKIERIGLSGTYLTFDDSVQHEAWNDADSDRIVLIFDVWRPELTEADRRGVAALFETVDAYR